uniref:Uncharacterized protein n=1 Tax=Vespula pensylvanica TaxID=30213 RepID=A0A834P614_VESPE|nr:hypothetical protein H0235_006046 [Vespula pensylvanica]
MQVDERPRRARSRTGVDFTRVQVVSANNDGHKRRDRINEEDLLPGRYAASERRKMVMKCRFTTTDSNKTFRLDTLKA